MKNLINIATFALVASALSACGNNDEHVCSKRFNNLSAFLEAGPCTGCKVNNLTNVVDDNRDSFADVRTNDSGSAAAGGSTTINVNDGNTYPAGSYAGAYILFPAIQNNQPVSEGLTIETYLGNTAQETIYKDTPSTGAIKSAGFDTYFGGKTTLPFDQILITTTTSGTTSESSVQIFEACADK